MLDRIPVPVAWVVAAVDTVLLILSAAYLIGAIR